MTDTQLSESVDAVNDENFEVRNESRAGIPQDQFDGPDGNQPVHDLEAPVTTSASAFASLPEALRRPLEERGFDSLTSVQEAVADADAAGRDLQISSQTGSGKTVALGIVLARGALLEERQSDGPEALVIVPTRELANQVSEELGWLFAGIPGTRVASVTGGTPIFRDRQTLGNRPRVLVGTPGRLLDHVRSGALDLSGAREIVLDEADQMLDMGFKEDLEAILDATAGGRRTHLVSATFPDGIARLARQYQNDPLVIEGTRLGDANIDIEHVGHLVNGGDRYASLVNILLLNGGTKTLVFVERRADTMELATRLEGDGFAALPISGDLAQSQRERTLAAFRDGRATILVATDVAARGLDVPDVGLVVQTAPPIDSEIYTHRSGRTGRAGNKGTCVLFAPPRRRRHVERLLNQAAVEIEWRDVPGADEVQRMIDERNKAKMVSQLDEILEKGLPKKHRKTAEELLETREPRDVVAALLAQLEPAGRALPVQVEGGGFAQERGSRHEGGGDARVRVSDTGKVRFFINYGENQGATPGRLLASVCRRGQVEGHHIGAIAIHPNASTFDVDGSMAAQFEELVSRRDPRDPQTFIRRDRGPVGSSGGARRGGGMRGARGGYARRGGSRGFPRGRRG
ncbi:ATP-dependent RNA helicase DbpA [Planctomycetes bacterium Poly30]|uniref:ATP-dependent RNA helicase DbpA n=1 Tax=Saltatorellus ferox TaxID=2528018 RepID=A0A518ESY1_9BACT|nr:ATP-dependent RNA helicase DbpA [Planctomycetes bacterium Poly30]